MSMIGIERVSAICWLFFDSSEFTYQDHPSENLTPLTKKSSKLSMGKKSRCQFPMMRTAENLDAIEMTNIITPEEQKSNNSDVLRNLNHVSFNYEILIIDILRTLSRKYRVQVQVQVQVLFKFL